MIIIIQNGETINDRIERFYDRGEFEIQIVDHCNLKCEGCNHFSNIASPWFMSLEEFTETIKLLSEKLGYLTKRLMILGGEPFLHP